MYEDPFIFESYRDTLVDRVTKITVKMDAWNEDPSSSHEELDRLLFEVMDTVVAIKAYLRRSDES
jgi:hypothetical protein